MDKSDVIDSDIHHPSVPPPSPIDVDMLPDLDGDARNCGSNAHLPNAGAEAHILSCSGIIVHVPPGKSVHSTYPFGLHDELGDPWNYAVVNGTLILRARNCQLVARNGDERCEGCNTLTKHTALQGVLDRMESGVHENSRLVYHGVGGLVKIVRQRTHQVETLRLRKLNDARKLISKAAALEDHKEWMMAIGSGKVERVDRLVRVGLAAKKGIRGMLELHDHAAQKVYRTQNYTEEDALRGLLLWCLGGARVAGIAHRALNLPSLSMLRRRTILPPIVPSPGQPVKTEVEKNIVACFEGIEEVVESQGMVHQVLMLDELKVEERPRWDDKSNMILGICREHGSHTSLEYTSRAEADMLMESIRAGDVHLAVEVVDLVYPSLTFSHIFVYRRLL